MLPNIFQDSQINRKFEQHLFDHFISIYLIILSAFINVFTVTFDQSLLKYIYIFLKTLLNFWTVV